MNLALLPTAAIQTVRGHIADQLQSADLWGPHPSRPAATEAFTSTAAAIDAEIAWRAARPAAIVPAFETATIRCSLGSTPNRWPLSKFYFATEETAAWIAARYGTGEVVLRSFCGNAGPLTASHPERHIVLPDGRTVNAGILAAFYVRTPEAQFPGYAEAQIRALLARP